jgi:hypothetical protein
VRDLEEISYVNPELVWYNAPKYRLPTEVNLGISQLIIPPDSDVLPHTKKKKKLPDRSLNGLTRAPCK